MEAEYIPKPLVEYTLEEQDQLEDRNYTERSIYLVEERHRSKDRNLDADTTLYKHRCDVMDIILIYTWPN
jgi:hypothetical protein